MNPNEPQFYYIKVGVYISWRRFQDVINSPIHLAMTELLSKFTLFVMPGTEPTLPEY